LDGAAERPAAAGDRDTVCVVGTGGSELAVRPISELLEIAVHRKSVFDSEQTVGCRPTCAESDRSEPRRKGWASVITHSMID
jgi:hypothetical protein